MPDVTETIDVHVPVRTAYAQWTQFESFPDFMDGVESVRQIDERHTHWVTKVGGVRREFDAEITEQHPEERIAWKSTSGDAQHAGVVTFHRLSDVDTRVTVQLAWQPEGFVEKAGAVMGIDDHQVKADTRRFKEYIEQRGTPTGQWSGNVAPPTAGWSGDVAAPTAGQWTGDTAAPSTDRLAAVPPQTAATDNQMQDIVDVLLSQHGQIKQALARVGASQGPDKREAFTQLVALLHLHEIAEQQVVHPVTRAATAGGDEAVGQRVAEEQRADQYIARLTEMGTEHPGFDEAFVGFREAVLAHAEHEEGQEFGLLRRDVPAVKLQAMAAEFLAAQNAQL